MKLVIASGKGGVGKSMLSSVLAMLFSQENKVVAVDCDVDAPNLAIWLGGIKKWDKTLPVVTSARPEIDLKKCNNCGLCAEKCNFEALKMVKEKPKVNQFLCEGCGACEVVCPQKAITLKPIQNGEIKIKNTKHGFPLIVGQLYPGETGSGKVVAEIKKRAEKLSYNLMIIDSSPGTGCPVIASLQGSDLAILITEPTPSGFADLKRALSLVKHFNISYRLIINKWDINKDLSQKIEKWAGKNLLGKISYDKEIFKAVANFEPLLETDLKAKKEIKIIFKKIKKWLDQQKRE